MSATTNSSKAVTYLGLFAILVVVTVAVAIFR